jgi:L-alanine-DL-glutamate epimerase-like enolase superfamily enzyme
VKITEVTPILLRGEQLYGQDQDGEATDQGDWLLLVRVRTDEGLEGWSDVETFGPAAVRILSGSGMGAVGFHTIAEELIGKDPTDIETLWHEMFVATAYYGRRGVAVHCLSAVDNCLWSIRAQAAGVGLADVLGGRRRDRIPAYASTLFRRTPQQNGDAARGYLQRGFRGVKFGWGGFGVDSGLDRENLAAITDALGPAATLMVDPGWYIQIDGRPRVRDHERTVSMLDVLAEANPYWIEDFVHPETTEQYADYQRRFPHLRFAAGEQQATGWEFRRLLREASLAVLQPDLSRCGGLTVAVEVAREAVDSGLEIVTHSWLTDLLHAYSLQFLASLPEATWVEFNVAQSRLSRGVAAHPMELAADGTVAVPGGIGLGVDLDMDFIRAHEVTIA